MPMRLLQQILNKLGRRPLPSLESFFVVLLDGLGGGVGAGRAAYGREEE